ncbi:glycosyltransferase [Candidatus Nitrospira bockiana]
MELVSVVIPCYKQAHFLSEAIESVLAQTHPEHDIIVVDDESPDDPARIVRRYPGVRYIRQPRQERCAARNRGLEASRGPYTVFLDADDRLLPEHFASCLELFRRHPDAGFVCGDYRWCGVGDVHHIHDCRPTPDHYATLLRTNFIGPPHTVMFRRDILLKEHGFNVELKSCEDQDLYLRIARAHPIYCHHRVIAEYRRHSEQTSQKWDLMLRYAVEMLRRHHRYAKGRPDYERAWRIGWHHRRRLYGEPLAWSTVAAARAGDWRRAGRLLGALLRWYPEGLVMLARHKMGRRAGHPR